MKNFTIVCALGMSISLSGCAIWGNQQQAPKPIEDPSSRSLETVIDDQALAGQIEDALYQADPRFDRLPVSVHVVDGVALLLGQVPEAALIQVAIDASLSVPRIQALHNHLSVGAGRTATQAANDSFLGIRIRSKLFASDGFPSRKVKVEVEQGIAYLMGSLSPSEAKRASELVRSVNGVQSVVLLFSQSS